MAETIHDRLTQSLCNRLKELDNWNTFLKMPVLDTNAKLEYLLSVIDDAASEILYQNSDLRSCYASRSCSQRES